MARKSHKNHSLANLAKECFKDEWNKMSMSLEKLKRLYKIKWIVMTSILQIKTPILRIISLRKFRIIISLIHVSSPNSSSSRPENKGTNPSPWLAFQDAAYQARGP